MQNLHAFRKTSDKNKRPISLSIRWPHRPLGFAFGPHTVREKCPNPLTFPCARLWRRAVFQEKLWTWMRGRSCEPGWERDDFLGLMANAAIEEPNWDLAAINYLELQWWVAQSWMRIWVNTIGTHYTLFACCSPYRYLPCPIPRQTTDENYRTRHVCYANTCSLRERAVSNENHLWSSGLMSKLHSLASTNKKNHQINSFSKITILFDFLPVPFKQIISISEYQDLHLVIEIFGWEKPFLSLYVFTYVI